MEGNNGRIVLKKPAKEKEIGWAPLGLFHNNKRTKRSSHKAN